VKKRVSRRMLRRQKEEGWRKIGPTCWEVPYYTNIYFIKYYFGYTMKKDEIDRACSTYEREEIIMQSCGRKSQWKRPLERNGHRWENNNKAYLK